MTFNHCSKRNYWPFEWFSKSPFIRSFPVCQEILDILQIVLAFHRISPPIFIQSWLQQYCWGSFFHSSYDSPSDAICLDEVLMFDDSMIDLHKIFQIPMSCPFKKLSVFATARGTFANSFPYLVKSLFFARIGLNPLSGKILNNDSVSVIVPWFTLLRGPCDQPLSSHQTFLLEVELRQCVFCKEPLSFYFASRLRNFSLLGKWVWTLCLLNFDTTFVGRSESESWEVCAGACTSASSRLSVNSSNHSERSRKRSSESRFSSRLLYLFWVFEGDPHHSRGAGSSIRSWGGIVDKSCNADVDDELLPDLVDNPGTTRGTKMPVLHIIVFPSLVNRGFWPLTHS